MKLMLHFFRAYPLQSGIMLFALLFAGIAEGLGLSALLPLFNLAVEKDTPGVESEQRNSVEQAINDALDHLGFDPSIGVMLIIVVLGVTLKSLLLLVAKRQVGYTAAQVATDLRLEMLRVMLRCKWEYFLHQPIGKFTNSLATEAQRASDSFVNGATVITFLVQAVIYFFVALAVSWKATLVSLAMGLVIVSVSHFLVRMARKAGKKQTKLLISLVARLTDTLQSVKPLKAMAKENLVDGVLAMETSKLNRALQKEVFSRAVLAAGLEEMITVVIALGMFVALVRFGMPFSTVMVLVLVLGKMLNQFGKVQKQYQKMVGGESAFWSMQSTISAAREAEEELGTGELPIFNQAIRLDQIDFSYDNHEVLRKLSLEIPAGSLTTLIGPSGSGKTTIIDLIIALLHPRGGVLSIDNIPLENLDIKAWRRMIGYVPQETLLLHDTVAHNVTLDDPQLSDADAERALHDAGAWDFVSQLPQGMYNIVGERGGKLSGGQRQRIVIARALAHRPKLLILDEATSALDPDSERAIRETLERLRGGLTILAISHQTALVDAADRVYRLDNGHAELLENRNVSAVHAE